MPAGDGPKLPPSATPAAVAPVMTIALFGAVRIWVDGREVHVANRKAQALLGYLAMHRDHQETRELLGGLLWSGSDSKERRQTSLRHEIAGLRTTLRAAGFDVARFDRLTLALPREHLAVDLWEVVRSAEAHDPHPLLLDTPRLTETLLADVIDVDPDFRDWLTPTRIALHNRIMRNLEEGLRAGNVPPDRSRRLALAIHNLDPTHEEACRTLMRARASNGDAVGAMRDYDALVRLLEDEHDTVPEEATVALYAAIKNGDFEARPDKVPPEVRRGVAQVMVGVSETQAPPPEPGAMRMALIVEPFAGEGIDANRAQLLNGFRDHLIGGLVRFREWAVTDARGPASSIAEPPAGTPCYVLAAVAVADGAGTHLQITLRDRRGGQVVWSNPFDIALESWFASRQRVTRELAMSLNVQLSAERLTQLRSRPDTALDVYDRWLRGHALMYPFRAENWNRAARIFEEAIRDAPGFAPAYSSLVQMNNARHIVHPGVMRDRSLAPHTVALARKAVELDPLDSRAHLGLGWALAAAGRHIPAAVAMDQAWELNPYDSWTLMSAALFHAYDGNLAAARQLADQSLGMTLSPMPQQLGYNGTILYLEGDYMGAIQVLERAQEVLVTLPAWRAAAHARLGHGDAARAAIAQFLAAVRARWLGPDPATDATIAHWLLDQYPMGSPRVWEHLRDGLAAAGLDVAAERYRPD